MADKRPMVQVKLSQGNLQKVCWVDKDPRLKQGADISLKDVEGRWKVEAVYLIELDISALNRQRNFDNNNYDIHKGLFS